MVVYKVVGKNKCSSNWAIYCSDHRPKPALLKQLIKIGWVKLYYKGRTITAHKASVGILCFKRLRDAEDFKSRYKGLSKIIKVEGIGKGNTKLILERAMGSYMRGAMESHFGDIYDEMDAPHGTIAYRSVKVLE